MASKKMSNILAGVACPVCCDEIMQLPIFQCKSGDNMCSKCYMKLTQKICPICRQEMTLTPNLGLEKVISLLKIPCPNADRGCKISVKGSESLEAHLTECIFRDIRCPLAIFGRCTWTGKLKTMMAHFKDRHPAESLFVPKKDCFLKEVNVNEDDRHVNVFAMEDKIFFLTCKLDTTAGMAFWTIQHIATKNAAQNWQYEIKIKSMIENRRNMTFTEQCFNDVMNTDDIFRTYRCAVVPLDYLRLFMDERRIKFSFEVKNVAPFPKNIDKRSDSPGDRFAPGRGNDNAGGSGDGNKDRFNGKKKDFKPNFHQKQDGKKFDGKKTHANAKRGNSSTKNDN